MLEARGSTSGGMCPAIDNQSIQTPSCRCSTPAGTAMTSAGQSLVFKKKQKQTLSGQKFVSLRGQSPIVSRDPAANGAEGDRKRRPGPVGVGFK